MVFKYERVLDLHYVGLTMDVLLAYHLKNSDLDSSLSSKLLIIFDYFQCHVLLTLMIVCFEHLAKGSSTNRSQYLVPTPNVVMSTYDQVSIFVINLSICIQGFELPSPVFSQ